MVEHYLLKGIGASDWYDKTHDLFKKEYGNYDLKMVFDILASTSIHATVKANVRLFRKALFMMVQGKDFDGFLPVVKMQLDRIREGAPIQGRKIQNFSKALQGDKDAVVVDLWMMRAFGGKRDVPTKREYDRIEYEIQALSMKYGYAPRDIQSMIWTGIRMENGLRLMRYPLNNELPLEWN